MRPFGMVKRLFGTSFYDRIDPYFYLLYQRDAKSFVSFDTSFPKDNF